MRIQITHPTNDMLAGLIYDVDEAQAQELIDNNNAFEIKEDVIEVSEISDKQKVYTDVKPKKVTHGNG